MKKIFVVMIFLTSVSQCFAEGEVTFYGMLGYGSNQTIHEDYRTGLDQYREAVARSGYPNSEKNIDGFIYDSTQAGFLLGSSNGLKCDVSLSLYHPRRRIEIQHPVSNAEQETNLGSYCYSLRLSYFYSLFKTERLKISIYGGVEYCIYDIRDESRDEHGETNNLVKRQFRSDNFYIGPSAGLMLKFAVLRFDTFSIDVLADGWVTWAYYDDYMDRKSCWNESFAGSFGIGMTVENVW